jgi:hypothetical protein
MQKVSGSGQLSSNSYKTCAEDRKCVIIPAHPGEIKMMAIVHPKPSQGE